MHDVPLPGGEQRRHPRNAMLQRAHIVLAHPELPIECTVRNISNGGALLKVGASAQLTASFSLLMSGTDLRSCVIARRDGNEVGIDFGRVDAARARGVSST